MPTFTPSQISHLCRRLRWEEINPALIHALVLAAREEDLQPFGQAGPQRPGGDATTSLLSRSAGGAARLVARHPLVVCGLPLIEETLRAYGPGVKVRLEVADGEKVSSGTSLATLEGPAEVLLPAERVVLNFLQKLSGIATHTRRHVEALGASQTRLLDTRKTTPGWRLLEKYAVACGGAWNHRLGLYDRIMLKDNHLAFAGAAAGAALADLVRQAKLARPDLIVEVEVDRLDQIPPVLEAGADVILLDNFTVSQLREAVALIAGRAMTEASGGVSLPSLPTLGGLGLDFISCGSLIHQATWVDIGLDWLS
jgi:nicotinate-nucleotide pyrophosphorylase (carboxylating)